MIQKLTQTTLKQLRFAPKLHMHQFVKAPLPFVRNNIFLFS